MWVGGSGGGGGGHIKAEGTPFSGLEYKTYEACSEIIETLAFYPVNTDLDKQNSAR